MNFFKFWPILGPFLALLGGLFYSPLSLASSGNPHCDLYVSSSLSPADKNDLNRLGYRPVSSPQLRFSIYSLRLHTDAGAWVLERSAKYDRLFFEMPDGLGNIPIMNFTLKAKGLPACGELKKSISALDGRRRHVLKALRYLRGDQSIRLFDALVDLEQLELEKRGKRVPPNPHYLNPLRTAAHKAWVTAANADFFDRLNGLRRTLITQSLRRYCRDQTTISELSKEGCTNCVGQTALMVSLYSDMRIQPPAPWQLGFVLYDDHMQPVLYDAGRNQLLDLMYNKVTVNKDKNPVLAPSELLRMALRKHRDLLWPLDQVVIDRVEYLSPESMLDFFTASRQAEPDVTAANAHSRVDAFSFQGIRTRSQWSHSPAPAAADLYAVAGAGYEVASNVNLGSEESLSRFARATEKQPAPTVVANGVYGQPSKYPKGYFSPSAIQELIPAERVIYEQMVRLDQITADDVQRFGVKQFNGVVLVAVPFVIQVQTALNGYAPFRISGANLLELPTQALADEMRSLPIIRRYQRLIELGRQFVAGPLSQDVEALAGLFESRTILNNITTSEGGSWSVRLSRLSASRWNWGMGQVGVFPDFEMDRLKPQLLRFEAAAKALSERWGREHRQFLEEASTLSEEEIGRLVLFFARLSAAKIEDSQALSDLPQRSHAWESVTRSLMLGILYDKKYFWTGTRTATERRQREELESTFIPVEEAQAVESSGPSVELPKIGVTCAPGQQGWVTSGSFAWRCPEQPQKRVLAKLGTQSMAVFLRSPREIPASLLSGLIILNYRLFLHPGHLVLLHEMWSDSIDKAQVGHVIALLSGGRDLTEYGREVTGLWATIWKIAPMLLSEKLPIGEGVITGPDFLKYTSNRREFPEWISAHPNYAQGYLQFRTSPRPLVAKRDLRFSSQTAAGGWSTRVEMPTGSISEYVAHGVVAKLNPRFIIGEGDTANGKTTDINLEARFGQRRIKVRLIDDGRSIIASPSSDDTFSKID